MTQDQARDRLTLLGGWHLTLRDNTKDGPAYQRGKALLAYLAITKSAQSREALSTLLWPDSGGHLRRVLSNLKTVLDTGACPPALLTDRHAIALNPDFPLWVDACAFSEPIARGLLESPNICGAGLAQMENLASLYHGDFMAGFSLPDCQEFEDWMSLEREKLRVQMLALLERLWQCHEQMGQLANAIAHARRHVSIAPWNEVGQRHLIRLLALNGQAAAALTQFEACRIWLEKELGVKPQAETLALVEQIRANSRKPVETITNPVVAAPGQGLTEHRLLTMLYCEFNVIDTDDPDDLDDALITQQERAVAIISACSGHIIQSQRIGVLACFGFPLARENAARQAVRAALKIRDELAARIGAHSGMVISQGIEPDIQGTIAATAIRLAAVTAPASILISEVTEQLIRAHFKLTPTGEFVQRQGMSSKSLATFRLEAENWISTCLAKSDCLTPLVGRQHELRLLDQFWGRARQAQAQTVLILGDAGIGKSRLINAFQTQLDNQAIILELRCHPEFEHTPFHPLLTLFERLCGVTMGDTASDKGNKLSRYLRGHCAAHANDVLELLGPQWQSTASSPQRALPSHRKEQLVSRLVEALHDLAAPHPMLLVIEDLHWCDPSTLEWLIAHTERRRAPVLTLLTARPEFTQVPKFTHLLNLSPLSASEVTELIDHLAHDLPATAVRGVIERADGIPLFVEELARVAQTPAYQKTPLTLQELLTTRLDSTGEAKPTACLAAVLGREVDLDLLRRISPLAPKTFDDTVAILLDKGLLHPGDSNTLIFRHSLIQEAAYRSLPKKTRKTMHLRVAEVLQSHLGEPVTARAETLARHLSEGGATLAAAAVWLEAGRNASLQSANQEAATHLRTGLSLLKHLPDDEIRAASELELQAALGGVMVALKGYGAEEARQHFTRAADLGRRVGDDAGLFPVIYGLWLGGQSDRVTVAPIELAGKLAQIAKRSGEPIHAIAANYAYGNNLFWLARHREARQHLEAVLSSFPEIPSQRLIAELGEDTRVSCMSFLAWIDWLEGYADRARQRIEAAIAQAEISNHAHSIGFAMAFSATLNLHIGLPQATESVSTKLLKLAEHHDLGLWTAVAFTAQGWAKAALGDTGAVDQIQQGAAAVRQAMKLVDATISLYLIDGLFRAGRPSDALRQLDDTLSQALAWEDRYLLAAFFGLKADILMSLDSKHILSAEALLNQSIEIARDQEVAALELRSTISWARVKLRQGQTKEAHQRLKTLYCRFAEGFDTPDYQAAKQLLAHLENVTIAAQPSLERLPCIDEGKAC